MNDQRHEWRSGTAHQPGHPQYWAFLSYSHRDKSFADWLHNALEAYRVPKQLVGRVTSVGRVPEKLSPVFRDRFELAASDDLGGEIRAALAGSRFLIVLCSPDAAASRWTNEEIRTFKQLHPQSRVLAAIVAGEPFASRHPESGGRECFPEALRHRYDEHGRQIDDDAEPIAADFRPEGDGKRLGLLKLVAGMLGLGLDELIQREAHRRQKRLAWLSAASLLGMAVTSGLALVAIDGRNDARDQRNKAEELVGFMLGDLRGRLEPLGRLDVLDSVGAKALDYYRGQDKGRLSDEALTQRSRALTLIGEISNRRGDLDAALSRYREALAGTAEALRREPEDGQRAYDHAQNVFWVGYIAWQRGQAQEAERAFLEYRRLAQRLLAVDANRPDWRIESVYAETNLGTLLLEQRQYRRAAETFQAALRESEALAAAVPGSVQYQTQLVESLANLADAQEPLGQLDEAMHNRERQVQLLERMARAGGETASLRRKLMAAHRALGRLFASRGEVEVSLRHLAAATSLADALMRTEPTNTEWQQNVAGSHLYHGELLLAGGRVDEAAAASRIGCTMARRLVDRDSSVVRWRTDLLAPCLMLRARIALARGHRSEAASGAAQLLQIVDRQSRDGNPIRQRYLAAEALMLQGDIRAAAGRRDLALQSWQAGLRRLPPHGIDRPVERAHRVLLLERLGEQQDAARLSAGLDSIGYRHPAYLNARQPI